MHFSADPVFPEYFELNWLLKGGLVCGRKERVIILFSGQSGYCAGHTGHTVAFLDGQHSTLNTILFSR
jgi:hypothetical protein